MPDTPFLRWPQLLAEHDAAWDAEIAADDRLALLRQARYHLERAARYERWGPLAIEDALSAAELLRQAGRPDLASECEDEFGVDIAAVLAEIEGALRDG